VIEVVDLAVLLESAARLARVGQLSPERLDEADLSQRFWTVLHHLVQRFESGKHGVDIVLALESLESVDVTPTRLKAKSLT
jgi:predicted ATP-grasp superfamily ATP-dependent carboligase